MVDRLEKQRALLDGLFEHAPEAVALMNVDHRVVRVNREFTRLLATRRKKSSAAHSVT
ncbi:MAG: hypothetical protein DMG58_30640 [Acidobacteria bacterium]|nr:MAG: hypothetical protein DMG58_30640 [Acidobacteriota bacterium]